MRIDLQGGEFDEDVFEQSWQRRLGRAPCSLFYWLGGLLSPAEKASKYYEKGLALMVQGDLLKALALGELSMWCESSKLRCTADGSFNADKLINNYIFIAFLLFDR
ncbi:hypothetical protein HK44_003365 [Pseudomonas fluorescens HK44]|uniref:Uncharacterized protein n=1 Tax=Pseudomonas fluorescens HK44 TaxID=1042209 RepID=A0A010T9M6_PSEFL|nr:hypothetical protein [Pseudomonas fluorescens]EXF94062.1 hypothetical protein HK44_003365 [Pseudomonas fluorescens HK44]